MDVLKNIRVEKLIFGGKGLGVAPDGKKIIIAGGVIPGSIIDIRVLKSRKSHFEGQYLRTVTPSPLEKSLPTHWQIYGGCKWLPIPYEEQLKIKNEQIQECFHDYKNQNNIKDLIQPILPSPLTEGYRNKLEFTWGKYISKIQNIHDEYRFGFHESGSFDRIEDCSYCVLGSEEANKLFHQVDLWARASGIPTYDAKSQEGILRHFVIRESHATKKILVIFSLQTAHPDWEKYKSSFMTFAQSLNLHSVYLLHNHGKADIVDGEFELLSGSPVLEETLLDTTFDIQPKSFFQTNSPGAEILYSTVGKLLKETGGILLDLYAGTGTIGILLAKNFQKVISVEIVRSASEDGKRNAIKNKRENIEFICESVEKWAKEYVAQGGKSSTIILDPPRSGMHPSTYSTLLLLAPKEFIYVSCNPSTLVRDLEELTKDGKYEITTIQPVDMFPHTHHIETIVRLEKKDL